MGHRPRCGAPRTESSPCTPMAPLRAKRPTLQHTLAGRERRAVMSSFARHDSSIIPDGLRARIQEMRSARDSRECRHAVALRAWEVRPWHRAWRVGVGLRRGQCFRGVSGCLQPCVTRGGRARWTSAALSYDASAILGVAVGRLARRRRPPFLRGAYGLLYRPPQTRRAKTQEAQQAAQTRDRTTNMQQRNLAAFTARGTCSTSHSMSTLTCRGDCTAVAVSSTSTSVASTEL